MFGEFNFIKKVDLSSLSCGDERPTVKAPFDGDVYDIQVEEDNLIICGPETDRSSCPVDHVVEGLNGVTYFKRRTQMRAKKMPNGVWRSIRSTAFPEMDADPSLPAEYRGGRFVELSNGGDGETYQYWPKTEPMLGDDGGVLIPAFREVAVTASCNSGIPTDDPSGTINGNTADVDTALYTIDFVGFDVFNNHYVKHFKVHEGGYNASKPDGIDYLESFDLNRMYAVGLFGNGFYNTYESIKTNEEVEKDFLQGDGYPDLNATKFAEHEPATEEEFQAEFASASEDDSLWYQPTAQCTDEIAYDSITEENLNGTDPLNTTQIAVIRAERLAVAKRPDLERWISYPFDFDEYQEAHIQKAANLMRALDELFPDDDGCTTNGTCTIDRERRRRAISAVDSELMTKRYARPSTRALAESVLDDNNVTDVAVREQFHAQLQDPGLARSGRGERERRASCPYWAHWKESWTFLEVESNWASAKMSVSGDVCTWPPNAYLDLRLDASGVVWHNPIPNMRIDAWGYGVIKFQPKHPILRVGIAAGITAHYAGNSMSVILGAKYYGTPSWWPVRGRRGHTVDIYGKGRFASFWDVVVIESSITFHYKDKFLVKLKPKIPRTPSGATVKVKGCFCTFICVGPIKIRIKFGPRR